MAVCITDHSFVDRLKEEEALKLRKLSEKEAKRTEMQKKKAARDQKKKEHEAEKEKKRNRRTNNCSCWKRASIFDYEVRNGRSTVTKGLISRRYGLKPYAASSVDTESNIASGYVVTLRLYYSVYKWIVLHASFVLYCPDEGHSPMAETLAEMKFYCSLSIHGKSCMLLWHKRTYSKEQ